MEIDLVRPTNPSIDPSKMNEMDINTWYLDMAFSTKPPIDYDECIQKLYHVKAYYHTLHKGLAIKATRGLIRYLNDKPRLLRHMLREIIWDEFAYEIATHLLPLLPTLDDHDVCTLLQKLFDGLSRRELLACTKGYMPPLLSKVDPHKVLFSLGEYYFTSSSEQLLENMGNYLVPCMRKHLGDPIFQNVTDEMIEKHQVVQRTLRLYHQKVNCSIMIVHSRCLRFNIVNASVLELNQVMEIMLRVKRGDTPIDAVFLRFMSNVSTVLVCKEPIKKYFKYYISYLVHCINDLGYDHDDSFHPFYAILLDLYDLSLRYFYIDEVVEIGAIMFAEIYKCVYLDQLVFNYRVNDRRIYGIGRSRAYLNLNAMRWRSIEDDVISICANVRHDYLLAYTKIFEVLTDLETYIDLQVLFMQLYQRYGALALYKEEDMKALYRLFNKQFQPSNTVIAEMIDDVVNALQMRYYGDEIFTESVQLNYYDMLIGFSQYLETYQLPENGVKKIYTLAYESILFITCNNYSGGVYEKFCERVLAVYCDIIVLCSSKIEITPHLVETALLFFEQAMKYNMRFSTAAVLYHFKKFISYHLCHLPTIYSYFKHKLFTIYVELDGLNRLRRNLVFKTIIVEVLRVLRNPDAYRYMFRILRDAAMNNLNSTVVVKALDTLEHMIRLSDMHGLSRRYIVPSLYIALHNLEVNDHRVKNACMNLIATVKLKLRLATSNYFGSSSRDLVILFPALQDLLEDDRYSGDELLLDTKLNILGLFSNASNRMDANNDILIERALSFLSKEYIFNLTPACVFVRSIAVNLLEETVFNFLKCNGRSTHGRIMKNMFVLMELLELLEHYKSYNVDISPDFQQGIEQHLHILQITYYKRFRYSRFMIDDWMSKNMPLSFPYHNSSFSIIFIERYLSKFYLQSIVDHLLHILIYSHRKKHFKDAESFIKISINLLLSRPYDHYICNRLVKYLVLIIPKYDLKKLGFKFNDITKYVLSEHFKYKTYVAFYVTVVAQLIGDTDHVTHSLLIEIYKKFLLSNSFISFLAFDCFKKTCSSIKREVLITGISMLLFKTPNYIFILKSLNVPIAFSLQDAFSYLLSFKYLFKYFECKSEVFLFLLELRVFIKNLKSDTTNFDKNYFHIVDSTLNRFF